MTISKQELRKIERRATAKGEKMAKELEKQHRHVALLMLCNGVEELAAEVEDAIKDSYGMLDVSRIDLTKMPIDGMGIKPERIHYYDIWLDGAIFNEGEYPPSVIACNVIGLSPVDAFLRWYKALDRKERRDWGEVRFECGGLRLGCMGVSFREVEFRNIPGKDALRLIGLAEELLSIVEKSKRYKDY